MEVASKWFEGLELMWEKEKEVWYEVVISET
jgi:hypothetical protein